MKQIVIDDLRDKVAPLRLENHPDWLIFHGDGYTFVFDYKGTLVNVIHAHNTWEHIYHKLVDCYTLVNQAVSMDEALEVRRNEQ